MLPHKPHLVVYRFSQLLAVFWPRTHCEVRVGPTTELILSPPRDDVLFHFDFLLCKYFPELLHNLLDDLVVRVVLYFLRKVVSHKTAQHITVIVRKVKVKRVLAFLVICNVDFPGVFPEPLCEGNDDFVHQTDTQFIDAASVCFGQLRLKCNGVLFQDSERQTDNYFLGSVHFSIRTEYLDVVLFPANFIDNFVQLYIHIFCDSL